MSQPDYKFDYDYAPKRETRGNISSVPSQGHGGDADPTVEIRHLINQLQGSARELRDRLAVVERERDGLRDQLDDTRAELLQVKGREEESRARFVEVTAVIRERDELIASLDQHQKSIAELQRRIDLAQRQEIELQRQRAVAISERETFLRERDAVVRDREDLRLKLADAQRQTTSIRQARDAAQANCHELSDKVQHLADQIAELSHERDTARHDAGAATEARAQCEALVAERDRLTSQLAESGREIESHRQRLLDVTEQQSKVTQASSEFAAALAAAREDVIKLKEERDAARNRAQEKDRELDQVHAEMQRVRAEATVDGMDSQERDGLNRRIEALIGEREALQAQVSSLDDKGAAHERSVAQFAEQIAAAQKGREEALTSLTAAQKQIEHIMRDRDQVRQQGVDQSLELEAQLQAARMKFDEMESKIADAERRVLAAQRESDRSQEKADHFEKQRLQSIDLAAQLDAATREIKRLTADLAEARLEAKAAGARVSRAKVPPPLPSRVEGATPFSSEPAAATPNDTDEEALSEREGKSLVAEMKRCFANFAKEPTDLSLLNELHCQVQHFAERARVSGFLALHRLGHAFANLAQDLYKFPEQINPSTLRTVSQTIEFINVLLKQKNYGALKDPAKALVFAVDDDADNCDAIRMAMENIAMRTKTAQEPSVALAELSANQYDLIFLDVALPHMDGFELCQHIRGLQSHGRTPIVFLTGLTTMENRVQSSLSGGNDFVGKPFNLHELGVKAISLVLRASLNMD